MWSRYLTRWSEYMRAAGLPDTTIDIRCYHLRRVAAAVRCPPSDVTTEQLLTWLSSQPWKPNTRRSYRSSLRAFYQWAVATGRVSLSPAHALPPVRVPRGRPHPTPEDAFLAALQGAPRRLVLATLLTGSAGLRRSECARARREDIEPDLLGYRLRVIGKGGHERLVPLSPRIADLILASAPGYLFPSRQGGHLTPAYLGKLIAANLPDGYATHSLRHRAGTEALRAANGNLRLVQDMLGHADPRTTAIYTLIDLGDMRAVIGKITPPERD